MNFRIGASQLDFYVDVRLRNFDGRWLAVAEISGAPEMGLGRSAREALAACLSPLGSDAVAALMADAQLVGVGLQAGENS
ncbi:MAG: hypothetical protein H0W81_02015 [Chloroflexi bacterium]|nr:hypothetical protein [Chloroflexota bacterium]